MALPPPFVKIQHLDKGTTGAMQSSLRRRSSAPRRRSSARRTGIHGGRRRRAEPSTEYAGVIKFYYLTRTALEHAAVQSDSRSLALLRDRTLGRLSRIPGVERAMLVINGQRLRLVISP